MSMSIALENESSDLYSKMNKALDEVIYDDSIPEVAGFRVSVVIINGVTEYKSYIQSYWSQIILIQPGTFITHGTAYDGAYTINFFAPTTRGEAIGIHIKQGNFGIIYSRINGGLLRPELFEGDEVDFYEYVSKTHGLIPMGITQDPEYKYGTDGNTAYDLQDFENAINIYAKGLGVKNGSMRAKFFIGKARALFQVMRDNDALICLNEAVKIDSSERINAMNIIRQFRRR